MGRTVLDPVLDARADIPTAPLDTPDVWRGADLSGRGDWQYAFTAADLAELLAAVAHAGDKPMPDWTRDDVPLPTLAPRVAGWVAELDRGRSFIMLRGFPVAEHSEETCAKA